MAASHEKAGGATPRQDFNTVNKTSFSTPRAASKAAILRSIPDRPADLGDWGSLGDATQPALNAMMAKMAKRGGHDPH